MFAGLYLTLAGVVSLIVSTNFASDAPYWGKFLNALVFGIGLVVIIFMNAELATSNMMFLTSGVLQKRINISKATKILLLCTLGNLIGSLLTAYLLSMSSPFQNLAPDAFFYTAIGGKLAKSAGILIVDGVLANILVNIAVMGQLLMKNELARIVYIIIALFIFVYFGFEHVIANFGSFSLAYFIDGGQVTGLTISHILFCWLMVFIGNYIGGGIVMGALQTWLLTDKQNEH